MSGFVVVKVGGSLYDLPDLGVRLRRFQDEIDAERIAVVAGGGITADAIRSLDAVHGLGDEPSHWLALRTLTINAHFLAGFLPNFVVSADIHHPRVLLDAFQFAKQDEANPDPIPHIWDATSDCVAAQLAWRGRADQLILLKSRPWSGDDWLRAAQDGVVDPLFPSYVKRLGSTMIRVVCLRGEAEASG